MNAHFDIIIVLKRFIQAQLNISYDEKDVDYKKVLTDNWKKISFTNLKKSLIVHISKQKSFLPLQIPKYKTKSSSKSSNIRRKKSKPLITGHHLPALTVDNTAEECNKIAFSSFQNETSPELSPTSELTSHTSPLKSDFESFSSENKNGN